MTVHMSKLSFRRLFGSDGRSARRRITPHLHEYERKVTSQFGEDGVIARVAADLGIARGTFFEFGISPVYQPTRPDDLEGNFVQLRQHGWQGTFLDGKALPAGSGVVQAFVTALNINTIWRDLGIPDDLDFLSIDVDGQDFWIWMALSYRPKVVVIEYNGKFAADRSVSVQFDVGQIWDGTVYHGASLSALTKLAQSKLYTLIWANGVNAIFIQDEVLLNREDFEFHEIFERGAAGFERVFKQFPPHRPDDKHRPWVEI